MVKALILIAILTLGCGSNDEGTGAAATCNSAAVGTWIGVSQNDQITISATGAFSYSGVGGCSSSGTFVCPPLNVTSGTMQVTIAYSTGGACLPAGTRTCAFVLNGNTMGYDCTGTGFVQYRHQ